MHWTWIPPASSPRTATRKVWPSATPVHPVGCQALPASPRIAVLEEPKLLAGVWLRPGNGSCANNVVAFMTALLSCLPSFIHPRVARADSGFCVPEWLDMLEARRLRYVVVARLFKPSQRVLRQDLIWETSEGPGPEVAEIEHQEANWSQPRRGSCCDMGSRTRSGPEARSGSTTRVTSIRRWSPTCP